MSTINSTPYALAIARHPAPIRRVARKVSGDVVLGFGLAVHPVAPAADHIDCDMVWGGLITPSIIKTCLDTLCDAFGADQIGACVRSWLVETSTAHRHQPVTNMKEEHRHG